jgi:serine/threonine protein kinase
MRRLRSVTYVRTTAIEAPIRKILQSGRFSIDVPRFERMMGDEVVYVVQITSRGGGDVGPAGWNWLVRHKFTAFANLHLILKGLRVVRDMPKFPRKGIALYTSQAMLEKRCQKLAEYLTALARTPIGRSSTFIDFLRPTKAAVYNPSGEIANVEADDDESPAAPLPPMRSTSPPLRSTSPALPAAAGGASGAGSPTRMPPKPKGVAPQPGSAVKSRQREKSSNKLANSPLSSSPAPVVTSSLSSSGTRAVNNNGIATRSDSSSGPSPPPVPSTPPPSSSAPPTPSSPPPSSDRDDGSEDALGESGGVDEQADLTTAVREANKLRRSAAKRPETLSLDDFEIIKLIGVGGFGKVFLCKKRSTGEILALKRLRKKLIEAKGQSAHVRTEKEVLEFTRALGNDSWLTRLFYSFETPDYLCLAMEYVPGGDLRIILDDFGVLDDEHARFYFCEMVMCVNTLHKLGYIHRDLKPANFLIDGHGHLKLGDFGLSKGADAANPRASVVVTRRLKAYSVVGTPQYMAKETLTGGGYDASVDWWALGCVARGTPVALGDGTARTIEDAVALAAARAPLELVSVDEADRRALVARCNAGQCSGVKACVRVALVDGRALELTPDHRVMTASRGWVEAAQLEPASDCVVVPLLETPLDVVAPDEAAWSHGSLTMANARARQQTLAFARLAGRGGRDVECASDRAAVLRDDACARGAALPLVSWTSCARVVPTFVSDAPLAVKREFLAALFGTASVRVERESLSLWLAAGTSTLRDIARLLGECGVDMRGHSIVVRRSPGDGAACLRLANVQSFASAVGLRYCARAQARLAAVCLAQRCGGDVELLAQLKKRELPSTVALRVSDVRACGKRETFDLSVPGTNAFVAGGVTVHNCILYEMLVGDPPFSGETADEIFEQVRNFGDAFQKAIASSAHKADSPLSPGAGQVVLKLICDTSVRLGDEQVEEIKALPWFESVDWNSLREAEPPFIPQLESAEDTTYFDGAKDRAESDPDKSIDRRPREQAADEDDDDDDDDDE